MGNHNICSKTDRALVAYLTSVGIPGDIYPAKRSLDKQLPFTRAWSHSATPPQEDPYSGNRNVEAYVEVVVSGVIEETQSEDDPQTASDALVSAVFDAFAGGSTGDDQDSSALAAAISFAAQAAGGDLIDFTCQSCKVVGETQGFNPRVVLKQGDAWVDSIHLELLCSPSNVS